MNAWRTATKPKTRTSTALSVAKKTCNSFVASGKGLLGIHSATDTMYSSKNYGDMIGGWFTGHPWHTDVPLKVDSPHHPLTTMFDADQGYVIRDEIYQFAPRGSGASFDGYQPYSREALRVLLSLNTDKFDVSAGARTDGDYAISWIRDYENGSVCFTPCWGTTISSFGIRSSCSTTWPASNTCSATCRPMPAPVANCPNSVVRGVVSTVGAAARDRLGIFAEKPSCQHPLRIALIGAISSAPVRLPPLWRTRIPFGPTTFPHHKSTQWAAREIPALRSMSSGWDLLHDNTQRPHPASAGTAAGDPLLWPRSAFMLRDRAPWHRWAVPVPFDCVVGLESGQAG